MLRILLLINTILLLSGVMLAQAPPIQWQKTFGGSADEQLFDIIQTADGGYVAVGRSGSGATGDKTAALRGGTDIWVVKMDANGNKQWDKTIGTPANDHGANIVQTADGGYIIGGYSAGGGGDRTAPVKGAVDYWLLKLDPTGTIIQWQTAYGGNGGNAQAYHMAAAKYGGYYISGFSNVGVVGDKTEPSRGTYDIWMLKVNSSGSIIWDKTLGSAQVESTFTGWVTGDGGYIGCGYSRSANKTEQAIPYLENALSMQVHIHPYYTIMTMLSLGTAYLSLKKYDNAKYYLLLALEKAEKNNLPEYNADIHYNLSVLFEQIKNYSEALKHQRIYFTLKDSLLNKEKIQAVNLLEVKYRTAEREKAITQNLLLINRQKRTLDQKNIWIYGIAGSAFLLILLLFSYNKTLEHKQKINLLKAMIEGEERERTRIGRELHDGIGGRLAAINMNFSAIQKRYEAFGEPTELDNVMKMMEDTSEEVRKTAHNLIPDILSRYSFADAVQIHCEQVSTYNLYIQVQIQELIFESADKAMELILYRIIQELVQNIVKHARATSAVVAVNVQEKILRIIVEDNGIGFNPNDNHQGIGLYNIQSRVKMLQGSITVESAKGIGTSIAISFDISKLKSLLSNDYQRSNNR